MSAPVDAVTRAENVDALYEWSASSTRYVSSAFSASAIGVSPVRM